MYTRGKTKFVILISTFFVKVPGEPQNVHASAINSSSVEVVWDPPADRDRNGVIRGYQIYVQPKNPVSEARNITYSI